MNPSDRSTPGSMETAARMFVVEMRRERRSFWVILILFFVLLGTMFAYNLVAVNSLSKEQKREEFRTIGHTAEALTDLRSQISTSSIRQKKLEMDRVAEQKMVGESLGWRNGVAEQKLKAAAIDYARRHFLGETLNMSSGSVVAYALERTKGEARPSGDTLLLRAAVADWNLDEDELGPLARALAEQKSPSRSAFGHAALAATNFRRAQVPANGFGWGKGCSDVVAAVDAAHSGGALDAAAAYANAGNLEASGLNLDYWRGQCLRRNGEPAKAKESFDRMLAIAEDPRLSDENAFKFQAFHGAGTVVTAMLDGATTAEDLAKARDLLSRAGALRIKNGAAPTGAFGSTENISFLLLRGDANDRLVQVLEHTGNIDAQSSLTWNLVARLAAARALRSEAFPAAFKDPDLHANYAALKEKYGSARQLDGILFETRAKLARRTETSLGRKELKNLLGPDFEGSLWIAVKCVRARDACLDINPLRDVAESDVPETQSETAALPGAASEPASAAVVSASTPLPN